MNKIYILIVVFAIMSIACERDSQNAVIDNDIKEITSQISKSTPIQSLLVESGLSIMKLSNDEYTPVQLFEAYSKLKLMQEKELGENDRIYAGAKTFLYRRLLKSDNNIESFSEEDLLFLEQELETFSLGYPKEHYLLVSELINRSPSYKDSTLDNINKTIEKTNSYLVRTSSAYDDALNNSNTDVLGQEQFIEAYQEMKFYNEKLIELISIEG